MTAHDTNWRFDAMTRDELRSLAGACTVVLPLGSTEQHGHHLPVSVDTTIVAALAERAVSHAAETIPVLMLPVLPFGFAHHHLPFGGTISLRSETYVDVLVDIVGGLAEQGFDRVVLLNGHGGNDAAMRTALDRLSYQLRSTVHLAAASYWIVAADALAQTGLESTVVPGHAGHFETSMMLALAPQSVQLDARPDDRGIARPLGMADLTGAHIRRPNLWGPSDGRTDDAQQASAHIGERAIADAADAIADFLIRFHRSATEGSLPDGNLATS